MNFYPKIDTERIIRCLENEVKWQRIVQQRGEGKKMCYKNDDLLEVIIISISSSLVSG